MFICRSIPNENNKYNGLGLGLRRSMFTLMQSAEWKNRLQEQRPFLGLHWKHNNHTLHPTFDFWSTCCAEFYNSILPFAHVRQHSCIGCSLISLFRSTHAIPQHTHGPVVGSPSVSEHCRYLVFFLLLFPPHHNTNLRFARKTNFNCAFFFIVGSGRKSKTGLKL